MPKFALIPIAIFTTILALESGASADVAGPWTRCAAEGKGCTTCSQPLATNEPDLKKAFETCQETAKARGFVEACRHRSGAFNEVFFCPQGVKVEEKKTGGCAGCAIDASVAPGSGALLAAGLGLLLLRRRRGLR
ncbi:Hypothetical protein A7982_05949 [Minicystis rosea]|nr:Hypothetical protein A7982_05949 [Minicystis rosea]